MKCSLIALAMLVSACRITRGEVAGDGPPDAREDAVRPVDRKILGLAAKYEADGMLRGREGELLRSQRMRRAVGWRTVEKVLAPVALAESLPLDAGAPHRIPAFHTWYGRDDVYRLFGRLYEKLGAEGRKRREVFSHRKIDEAFAWNLRAADESGNWPEPRWRAYLAALETAEDVDGVGGIDRVGYGSESVRHLLRSYPQLLGCIAKGVPAPNAVGPETEARPLVRERLHLGAREQRTLGPFAILPHEGEASRGALETHDGAAVLRYHAHPELTATVSAGPDGFEGAVLLDYDKRNPEWATCVAGTFPIDAVVIKADWQRADFGRKLRTYDTSAAGLRRRLAPDGAVSWEKADGEASPGPESIHTIKLPETGHVYRLAGLHIMSKELDHWLWTTLWWSGAPDEDFGADRPSSIEALGTVWRNYKMCTVVGFDEADPDPKGGFGEDLPTLAEALAAVSERTARATDPSRGRPSWCSNPYIERGAGNAGTNCVGCHQHGGRNLRPQDILRDETQFPARGRTHVRNNFPTDYSWAINAGDRLGQLVADVVGHYDTTDPRK
ncbi:hypothetical protein [Pendulispora albinea]|uniref:Cytochrome c domain-containing protein n=1 Tax=Pendulispora albinea TaxID=2741071 RepID=A0ABZ2M2A8_9BACT